MDGRIGGFGLGGHPDGQVLWYFPLALQASVRFISPRLPSKWRKRFSVWFPRKTFGFPTKGHTLPPMNMEPCDVWGMGLVSFLGPGPQRTSKGVPKVSHNQDSGRWLG